MKTKKVFGAITMFILMAIGLVTSASAAKMGDAYAVEGVQIGWVLLIVGVIAGLVVLFVKTDKKVTGLVSTVAIVALVVGAACISVDVTPVATGEVVTADIDWSVVAALHQGGNCTIDNENDKIVILCHVNSGAGTMLDTDDTAFTLPIINFTICPSQTAGLTDLDKGVTTLASVVNPDQSFSVSGTSYDLFEDVSGTSTEKNIAWVLGGTTEYESRFCTVQFGSSAIVQFSPTFNPAGISQLATGTIKSAGVSIGGVDYTINLIIVEAA